jgi:hypothetical protein
MIYKNWPINVCTRSCSWVENDVYKFFVAKASLFYHHESEIEEIGFFEELPE